MANNIIEIDKIKTSIPNKECSIPKYFDECINVMGLQIWQGLNKISLSISGKLFVDPYSLRGIVKDNYKYIPDAIKEKTGIEINPDYFLKYAEIYEIHVKKDLFVKESPQYYISDMREVFKAHTDRYDITRYDETTYKEGLKVIKKPTSNVLVPKSKKNSRAITYDKGAELLKYENKEFREMLDRDFLEETKHCLRFEYQIRNYEEMRKAFGLNPKLTPNLENIFNSDKDPVSEYFNKLLSLQKEDVDDDENE